MWNKPQLLNTIADLLFLVGAGALMAGAIVWLARVPALPVRQVVFANELQHLRRVEVEQTLPATLAGNIFSLNLETVRGGLEKMPWVRRAEVRRVWPGRLEVWVEEHKAAARWASGLAETPNELVNTYGEVFSGPLTESEAAKLPLLRGPRGTSAELLKRYAEFAEVFRPVGRKPAQLVLSPRLAWHIKLDNGTMVDLGREQPKAPVSARLQRFVEIYPSAVATRQAPPAVVDLRYPNGFAMRLSEAELKGK